MLELGMYFVSSFLRGIVLLGLLLVIEKIFHIRLTAPKTGLWWLALLLIVLVPVRFNTVQVAPQITVSQKTVQTPAETYIAEKTNTPPRVVKKRVSVYKFSAMGALIVLVVGLVKSIARLRKLRRWRRKIRNYALIVEPRILELWNKARALTGQNAELRDGSAPMSCGAFHPCVLFPLKMQGRLSDGEITMLLVHELEHIRRRDSLWIMILYLGGAWFWFNPFYKFCWKRLCQSRESDCDSRTLKYFDGKCGEYAGLILKFALWHEQPPAPAGACLSRNAREIKQRITEITMKPKQKLAITILTLIILGGLLIPGCIKPQPKTYVYDPEKYIVETSFLDEYPGYVEVMVNRYVDKEKGELLLTHFKMAETLKEESVIISPKMLVSQNQTGTIQMIHRFEPVDKFTVTCPSRYFGDVILDSFGAIVKAEGYFTSENTASIKFLAIIRTPTYWMHPEQGDPGYGCQNFLFAIERELTDIKLGEPVRIPMKKEAQ